MLNDLVRSADAAAYEWTDSGTLVARRGGRSSSRTSRELEAIARSSYSHQAALSLGNPGSWYQHEYQRRPGRDGVPRSASPAVIRWAAQMAERQEPLSWEAGRRALLGAATQMAETTELKMALEASIHTAIAALPECTLCEGDEPFECSLCLDMVEAGERVRTLGCAHRFHTRCIDQWLCEEQRFKDRRCPLCNANPIEAHVSPQTSRGSRRGPSGNRGGGESGGESGGGSQDDGAISWGGVSIDQLLPRRLLYAEDAVDAGASIDTSTGRPEPPEPSAAAGQSSARRRPSGGSAGQDSVRRGALGVLLC